MTTTTRRSREVFWTLPATTEKLLEAAVATMQAEGYRTEILDEGRHTQRVRGRKTVEDYREEDR